MKTIRTFAIAAALACAAGTTAEAQSTARDSSTAGVHFGVYLNHSAMRVKYDQLKGSAGSHGLGLHAGYVYAPGGSVFVRVDVASMGQDGFVLRQADLGLRASLGRSGAPLQPFLQGSIGARGLGSGEADVGARGVAFTGGGGVEYFVSRTVAIEGGLSLSAGRFSKGRVGDGDWEELGDGGIITVGSRFDIGVSWHP
jgi:hypothetical protein